MATYTEHYQLHQWQPEDPFLRTDFNQDLQKIDTALGGLANQSAALEAAVATAAAAAGNCEMELITYIGTGTKGDSNPTKIDFTTLPDLFIIGGSSTLLLGRGGAASGILAAGEFHSEQPILWKESKLSISNSISAQYQMNIKDALYWVLGLKMKV